MAQKLFRILIVVFLFALLFAHVVGIARFSLIDQLDAMMYDTRLRYLMPRTQDRQIVIVDIDEKSLAERGRWPWSRDQLALLLKTLFDRYHVTVVGFDIVFAEPDHSSGLTKLDELAQHQLKNNTAYQSELAKARTALDYDRLFVAALRNRPVVLGYYFNNGEDARINGQLPAAALTQGAFQNIQNFYVENWNGYGANLPMLQQAAFSAGHFNQVPDGDGIVRRVPILLKFQDRYYESLALAMLRAYLQKPPLFPHVSGGHGIDGLDLLLPTTTLTIPTDHRLNVLIPYRGKGGPHGEAFQYFSATDILSGKIDTKYLTGKIVLVGTTAPGLQDLRSTPVGKVYPGVEVHASLLAGMLGGYLKTVPDYSQGIEIVQLIVISLWLTLTLPFLSAWRTILQTGAICLAIVGLNFFFYEYAGLALPLASSLLFLLFSFMFNMSWGYLIESKHRRQITSLFGSYVPPELVNQMAHNPGAYTVEGVSEELTILFSDIRDFTSISESLSPTDLREYINDYLTRMSLIIHEEGHGTLDKYIGDGIMAFWGAPVKDTQHAVKAVQAALHMQREVHELRKKFTARGWPYLYIGIGLNTGVVSVGDMGSKIRRAYTVMGDAVNVAARIEDLTKIYGVAIIVGELTMRQAEIFCWRELDTVKVKGKDKPVTIYEPVGLKNQIDSHVQQELDHWHTALHHYRRQEWLEALTILNRLLEEHSDSKFYALYRQRIVEFQNLPASSLSNWNGVTNFHDHK